MDRRPAVKETNLDFDPRARQLLEQRRLVLNGVARKDFKVNQNYFLSWLNTFNADTCTIYYLFWFFNFLNFINAALMRRHFAEIDKSGLSQMSC